MCSPTCLVSMRLHYQVSLKYSWLLRFSSSRWLYMRYRRWSSDLYAKQRHEVKPLCIAHRTVQYTQKMPRWRRLLVAPDIAWPWDFSDQTLLPPGWVKYLGRHCTLRRLLSMSEVAELKAAYVDHCCHPGTLFLTHRVSSIFSNRLIISAAGTLNNSALV